LISGPSKTADVEQTMQLGAHGPRRLHVILYD
jgi:L-lactate dehydrogenase complex protein LldG